MANEVILRVRRASGVEEERVLPPGRFKVGREAGDVLLIEDTKVSSLHAELEVARDVVTITDLASTNGIFDAAGNRLSGPYQMVLNQPVRLGLSTLTLTGLLPGRGRTEVAATPSSAPQASFRPVSPERQPLRHSVTMRRYEEANTDLRFWRRLVGVVGLAFVGAVIMSVLLVFAGQGDDASPTMLVSAMTAIASGGALAWVIKRRDEAVALEKHLFRDAAIGTAGVAEMERAQVQR
ncbi:MAG: hypothetical protein RL685_856 [Pseudomonadota bacterium]